MNLVLITGLPGTGKSTMAEVAGRTLGAPVLGHDWAMSGLRPYPELQETLDAMGRRGHRGVGWSLLLALARSQLRLGSPVVLDGVAREPEVEGTRLVAGEEGVGSLVVLTSCRDAGVPLARRGPSEADPGLVRAGLGPRRAGPASWAPPSDVDLVLEAADPVEENAARLESLLTPLV